MRSKGGGEIGNPTGFHFVDKYQLICSSIRSALYSILERNSPPTDNAKEEDEKRAMCLGSQAMQPWTLKLSGGLKNSGSTKNYFCNFFSHVCPAAQLKSFW
jgi:hypothetical protein